MSNIKLENLEINGYMIYQDKDSFNFGIDAVLLANFALREYGGGARTTRQYNDGSYTKNALPLRICDLCTGTLPIPLIMYAKRKDFLCDNINIDSFEIDSEQVDLCNKSIKYNNDNVSDAKNIVKDIKVFNDDINNIMLDKDKYKDIYEHYDIVTVNPPYNKKGSGVININDKKVVARHEVSVTFDEICKVANHILKSNKKFYIINHSDRLSEISSTLKSNQFEIKKLEFVHTYVNKPSSLVLIEAVKNAKEGLKVLPPIIIYENDGKYTENVSKIYGK